MTDLILHHYNASSYSEKIRSILGYKGLSWRSVIQSDVLPKPYLVALTGGYRLVPVLQIGSEIFCDSRCIVRRLEQEKPLPSVFVSRDVAVEQGLSQWGESIFFSLVTIGLAKGVFSAPSSIFSDSFIADRQKMSGPGFNPDVAKRFANWRVTQLRLHLSILERQLEDSRPFLLGDECSIADFSAYHPLWSLEIQDSTDHLRPYNQVMQWLERMRVFGHGERSEFAQESALAIAADSVAGDLPKTEPAHLVGFTIGQAVKIRHEAYNGGTVTGVLAWADESDFAIRRTDDAAGDVLVHFPKEGFTVSRVQE